MILSKAMVFTSKSLSLGTFIYRNGDKFQGQFLKGKKHGYGKLFAAEGRRIYGEWNEDELQHF
jgi:hypothetical protein